MQKTKVFVYETLKDKDMLKEALGKSLIYAPAVLEGYSEVMEGTWPTLRKTGTGRLSGRLIEVSLPELLKLDEWEDRYQRITVETDKGKAWAYVLKSTRP